MAQHATVLGYDCSVRTDPAVLAQSTHKALQSDSAQESGNPESPCLAPRASAIKEQGVSEAVAARIEASQRGSIRSVFETKGGHFYAMVSD